MRTLKPLFIGLSLVVALVLNCFASVSPAKAEPLYITSDTTWLADQLVDRDVVIQNGAVLTIATNVTVNFTCTNNSPYPGGYDQTRNKILVEDGTLVADHATFKASAGQESCWYGIIVEAGNQASITYSDISGALIGILTYSTITIENNTISYIHAASANGGGATGFGIQSMGGYSSIRNNEINDIIGRGGDDGSFGAACIPLGSGDGNHGYAGSAGLQAAGIYVQDSSPFIENNIIYDIWGGQGGAGGAGSNGCWHLPPILKPGDDGIDGGEGGGGGDGATGGNATGIKIMSSGNETTIINNTIDSIYAGMGGAGGLGGNGGNGSYGQHGGTTPTDNSSGGNGGNGGAGGHGGSGGMGGTAYGIYISSALINLQFNSVFRVEAGGGANGGNAGVPGNGGQGGDGKWNGVSYGTAGNGGAGGNIAFGGNGGAGGQAFGITIASTTGSINANQVIYTKGGDGGMGGDGFTAGSGGNGGNGATYLTGTNGGTGGNGGFGGGAGYGADGGSAYALSLSTNPDQYVLTNNIIAHVISGAGGDSGVAGTGGAGGSGGTGGGILGIGGMGGDGGTGGGAGSGGNASISLGVAAFANSVTFTNNTIYNILAQPLGGSAGAAGYGGSAGSGGSPGGAWGTAGANGTGSGSAGSPGSATGYLADSGTHTLNNNILANESQSGSQYGVRTQGVTTIVHDYNDFWNWSVQIAGGGLASHDFSGNPLFVNAAAYDYQLSATSPCIDQADAAAAFAPLTDFSAKVRGIDGNNDGTSAFDVGAHEFGWWLAFIPAIKK